jgi:protein-tyrosine phosphatase
MGMRTTEVTGTVGQQNLEWVFLSPNQEERPRRLVFTGTKNFRDLGGYRTVDGRSVRWGRLYRSDALNKLAKSDLEYLAAFQISRLVDLRAAHEKEEEPDRLPQDAGIQVVEIPLLDSSTEAWHDNRRRLLSGDFRSIDTARYLVETNIELATRFAPQFNQFVHVVLEAQGRPVLFHCAAGKDRTGFAAAILLRILGVPQSTVMEDYLLSNEYYLPSFDRQLFVLRLFRGKRFASVVKGFLEVKPEYLTAAFKALDREFGSFDNYIQSGLGLTAADVEQLRAWLLE